MCVGASFFSLLLSSAPLKSVFGGAFISTPWFFSNLAPRDFPNKKTTAARLHWVVCLHRRLGVRPNPDVLRIHMPLGGPPLLIA
jgi:hypothetical protein